MPRVIKHPDQRRAEILDLAMAAFLRSGYDNVSLNEIISTAGVSKGAFYHWFASKEALITALAERNAQQGYNVVEDAVNRCTGDALERLNTLLEASFDVKVRTGVPEILVAVTSLLRPENAYLYDRIVAISQELFRPLLTRVISDGVREGLFNTFDPEGVGDMLQTLAASTNTMLLKVLEAADGPTRNKAIEDLTARYRLHGYAIDRTLGLPDGSTRALSHDQVRVICAGKSASPGSSLPTS